MIKLPVLFVSLLLVACTSTSDVPNFERMSPEQLAQYNSGRSLSQMIVCTDDDRAFSRVRRRRCATVEQMYGSAQQAEQLGVLNQVPGYTQ